MCPKEKELSAALSTPIKQFIYKIKPYMINELLKQAQLASRTVITLSDGKINHILRDTAAELIRQQAYILQENQKDLNRMEAMQRAVTDLVILCCSFGMFFLMYHLYQAGNVTFDAMLLATIAMMGSFGPVTALSSLSNNLNQTLASGERVLSLLEEEPMVEELEGEVALSFEGASVEDVTFAYNEEIILKDCNINMKQGKVIGICGKSGCGKSTLLKLLMRFWDVNKGNIKISEENVKEIPTKTLRNIQSYVTQETELFHDSIANNIAIGKPGAAREEIIKEAETVKNMEPDFVEWRADCYEEGKNSENSLEMLKTIHCVLDKIPLLFTFRTDKEGGSQSITCEDYVNLLENAAKTGFVDLIDVEAFFDTDRTESLMKRLKECGVYVAASNHHFDRTPSIEEMVKRMETMDRFGADILKLAVMPKSDEDLMSLLTATVMMKRRTEKPVITMSMGKTGVLSRLCGEASGSAVTFAAGIKASAPGQIPAERMRRTLQLLHESFT